MADIPLDFERRRVSVLAAHEGWQYLVLKGAPEIFRTAWFVESMATQVLVVFVIRTTGPPWASRPHPFLALTPLGALGLALTFVLSPLGAVSGFAPLPAELPWLIAGLVVGYLILAEALKRVALRRAG